MTLTITTARKIADDVSVGRGHLYSAEQINAARERIWQGVMNRADYVRVRILANN